MFLNQPSQQNVKKIPLKDFCNGCFTALMTAFGMTNLTYIKQNNAGFTKNGTLKNTLI